MRGFIREFKEFAMTGSVMDLAVGMIIGSALTAIVTSLVDDILNPIIGLFVGNNFSDLAVEIGGATLAYGKFIMAIINFVIVAFVIFCIVKAMNKVRKDKEGEEPVTKICPYCQSEIDIKATRCPNCTSELKQS